MTLLEKFEEYDSLATSIWDSDQTKAFFEFREPLIAALT
jgi:hypothetical protein